MEELVERKVYLTRNCVHVRRQWKQGWGEETSLIHHWGCIHVGWRLEISWRCWIHARLQGCCFRDTWRFLDQLAAWQSCSMIGYDYISPGHHFSSNVFYVVPIVDDTNLVSGVKADVEINVVRASRRESTFNLSSCRLLAWRHLKAYKALALEHLLTNIGSKCMAVFQQSWSNENVHRIATTSSFANTAREGLAFISVTSFIRKARELLQELLGVETSQSEVRL